MLKLLSKLCVCSVSNQIFSYMDTDQLSCRGTKLTIVYTRYMLVDIHGKIYIMSMTRDWELNRRNTLILNFKRTSVIKTCPLCQNITKKLKDIKRKMEIINAFIIYVCMENKMWKKKCLTAHKQRIYIKFLKSNDALDTKTLLNGGISLDITKNRF